MWIIVWWFAWWGERVCEVLGREIAGEEVGFLGEVHFTASRGLWVLWYCGIFTRIEVGYWPLFIILLLFKVS